MSNAARGQDTELEHEEEIRSQKETWVASWMSQLILQTPAIWLPFTQYEILLS